MHAESFVVEPFHHWERLFLLSLTIVASGLRILFLIEVHDNPFFNNPTSDAYYYDAQAQSIAGGDVIGKDVFFRAPGYPYWLGLIYGLVGHSYLAVRIIQHALGVVSLVLLYLLARRLFSPAVGVMASLLALFYPVLLYFEGQLLFDWFLSFLCILWVFLYSVAARERNGLWFLLGLLFGIICVTRPTFLPLALPLFGYQIWRVFKSRGGRSAVRFGIITVAGLAAAILPVTVRNYIVGKDMVLIASQGGINFYIGNNPNADGYTARMPGDIGAGWEIAEMTYDVEKELGHHPKPSEESAFWYAKGIGFVFHQPIDFVKLLVKKLYLFWNALEIPNNLDFYTFSQYSLLLRVMPVGFWCVGPLGAVGMILGWKSGRGRMMVSLVLMYCLVMILFFVCDRYRLPVVLPLCVFAAYALETLSGWFRRKEYRPLVLYGALLALLALAMNSNLYHIEKEEPVHQFYMLGLIEQQHGDYGPASSHFAKASSYGKPMRNVYLHWGECEAALGHVDEAKENFRRELSYHPDSYGALADLSALFLANRMLDSAILYGTRAIPIKPFMSVAYVSVGQAFTMLHELARAESVLAEGSGKCGAEFRYGNYLLAGVYLEQGKIEKAESAYRSALLPRRSEGADYEPAYLIPEEKKMGIDEQTLRAKVLYGLGHVFVSRRQLDSAVACFRAATTASPSLADAWADLGVALLQTHDFPSAETAMREALRLQPDNFMYWYNYGSLLGAMERFAEARQAFEKTLSFRPDFQPARKDLEVLTRVSGK